MKHDIAFLHTAEVHAETFSRLVDIAAPELSVRHDVAPELLAVARSDGMTRALEKDIEAATSTDTSTRSPTRFETPPSLST